MNTGHYADPTAWAAIANVDRAQKKKKKKTYRKTERTGVYRNETINHDDVSPAKLILVRRENISPLVYKRIMAGRSSKWPRVRKMAWDRDRKNRAVCHICGGDIDYTLLPSSAPGAWEPDHVIPVSVAPELELDLSNIKASHMKCNRTRGRGADVEIGMRSRVW